MLSWVWTRTRDNEIAKSNVLHVHASYDTRKNEISGAHDENLLKILRKKLSLHLAYPNPILERLFRHTVSRSSKQCLCSGFSS